MFKRAKRRADRLGKSVSQLVADYFTLIESAEMNAGTDITPRVQDMIGSLKGAAANEADYRRHLEERNR
ncbi:MAG: antitoxin [Ignavibacteria bacterium]|nr:antitoxin [Ignavibacteria bacterium]